MGIIYSWLKKQHIWSPEISNNILNYSYFNTLSLDSLEVPTLDSAQAIYTLLKDSPDVINTLKQYTNCNTAISTPSSENDILAYTKLSPSVHSINIFYHFSTRLQDSVNPVLVFFCNPSSDTFNLLDSNSSTAIMFAHVLLCIYNFDSLKISNPNLQNDFSFYRRSLPKIKSCNYDGVLVLQEELTNRISLFLAQSNPLLKSLLDSISALLQKNLISLSNLTNFLFVFAAISFLKLQQSDITIPMQSQYLQIMVLACIIYDNLDPKGVFYDSKINMKSVIESVKNRTGVECTEGLLNALRFSTIHFNDEKTPKSIRELLK